MGEMRAVSKDETARQKLRIVKVARERGVVDSSGNQEQCLRVVLAGAT